MHYEEALKAWGARKLREQEQCQRDKYRQWSENQADALTSADRRRFKREAEQPVPEFDPAFVEVSVNFDPGGGCVTCSPAPSSDIEVLYTDRTRRDLRFFSWIIPLEDFDFATFVRELVEAADGAVTS